MYAAYRCDSSTLGLFVSGNTVRLGCLFQCCERKIVLPSRHESDAQLFSGGRAISGASQTVESVGKLSEITLRGRGRVPRSSAVARPFQIRQRAVNVVAPGKVVG